MKADSSSRSAVAPGKKGLKFLLQRPFTPRSEDVSVPICGAKALGSIPTDVILDVAERLATPDILNLSLTCSQLRSLLTSPLYSTVVLKSSRQCRVTLNALLHQPEICAKIRKLAVRPNYYLAWPKPDEPLDESWVVSAVAKIAPKLVSLHTFDWDGLEMPDDYIWSVLRTCCPLLKTVFTNVGSRLLDPQSQLFDFSGLTSFSLIVRHGLGGSDPFPPMEELPERLWNMLLNRCPDLEEVTICSFSSSARLFQFDRITTGRWPNLHTLTLGSFGYASDFSISQPSDASFGRFLTDHSSIKHLRLSWNFKRWMSPELIPLHLQQRALPELNTYIGIYQQLAEFPNPSSIETLDLTCEPIYESRVVEVSSILQRLTSLTTLDIWVYIPNPNLSYQNFFEYILGSCPKLTELHFMCTTAFPVKLVRQLSSLLSLLPDLQTFSLTKGHKYRDESMLQTAVRLVRDNPSLHQVNIRWARESCPNHLKQEGSYDVKRDEEGNPISLSAYERGLTVLGRSFHRHFQFDLKPHGRLGALKQQTLVTRYR